MSVRSEILVHHPIVAPLHLGCPTERAASGAAAGLGLERQRPGPSSWCCQPARFVPRS